MADASLTAGMRMDWSTRKTEVASSAAYVDFYLFAILCSYQHTNDAAPCRLALALALHPRHGVPMQSAALVSRRIISWRIKQRLELGTEAEPTQQAL